MIVFVYVPRHSIRLLMSPRITVHTMVPTMKVSSSLRLRAVLDRLPPADTLTDILGRCQLAALLPEAEGTTPAIISKHASVQQALEALRAAPQGVLAVTNSDLRVSSKSVSSVAPAPTVGTYIGWLDATTVIAARLQHGYGDHFILESLGDLLQFDVDADGTEVNPVLESSTGTTGTSSTSAFSSTASGSGSESPHRQSPSQSPDTVTASSFVEPLSHDPVLPFASTCEPARTPAVDRTQSLPVGAVGPRTVGPVTRARTGFGVTQRASPRLNASAPTVWRPPPFHPMMKISPAATGVQRPRAGGRFCRNPFWALPATSPLNQVCFSCHCHDSCVYVSVRV